MRFSGLDDPAAGAIDHLVIRTGGAGVTATRRFREETDRPAV